MDFACSWILRSSHQTVTLKEQMERLLTGTVCPSRTSELTDGTSDFVANPHTDSNPVGTHVNSKREPASYRSHFT
jgi:hypothetical protein